jgi:uncharacterized protein YuzE
MKIKYDASVDILVIRLCDAPIVGSKELSPGIIADFDREKNIVGLEILDASDRYSKEELSRFSYERLPA